MKIISRPGAEGEIVTNAAALRDEIERLQDSLDKRERQVRVAQAALNEAATQILELRAKAERLRTVLRSLYEWYDRDGSVGGASQVFEDNRAALEGE